MLLHIILMSKLSCGRITETIPPASSLGRHALFTKLCPSVLVAVITSTGWLRNLKDSPSIVVVQIGGIYWKTKVIL